MRSARDAVDELADRMVAYTLPELRRRYGVMREQEAHDRARIAELEAETYQAREELAERVVARINLRQVIERRESS